MMSEENVRDIVTHGVLTSGASGFTANQVDGYVFNEEMASAVRGARLYGYSTGGGGSSTQPGCFEIVQGDPDNPEDPPYHLENRYFNVGTQTYEASEFSFTSPEPGMALVLAVNLVSAEPWRCDTEYAWISGSDLMHKLQTRQTDTDQVAYVPLYLFDGGGSVKCRFVHGIHVVQAYERRGVF